MLPIPHGRENAISRAELSALLGIPDREVRRRIKAAIASGEVILSSASHRGYWRSDDIEEIQEFIRESDARRRAEYLTTRKLRRLVARKTGAKTVKVREHERRI